MAVDKQVPATDYCPVQKKKFTVYGNYIYDGLGHYELGTILCGYTKSFNACTEKECPIRSKLPKTI